MYLECDQRSLIYLLIGYGQKPFATPINKSKESIRPSFRLSAMSLRQLRRKAVALVPRDGSLLAALRSELAHELASSIPHPQAQPLPSQVKFTIVPLSKT